MQVRGIVAFAVVVGLCVGAQAQVRVPGVGRPAPRIPDGVRVIRAEAADGTTLTRRAGQRITLEAVVANWTSAERELLVQVEARGQSHRPGETHTFAARERKTIRLELRVDGDELSGNALTGRVKVTQSGRELATRDFSVPISETVARPATTTARAATGVRATRDLALTEARVHGFTDRRRIRGDVLDVGVLVRNRGRETWGHPMVVVAALYEGTPDARVRGVQGGARDLRVSVDPGHGAIVYFRFGRGGPTLRGMLTGIPSGGRIRLRNGRWYTVEFRLDDRAGADANDANDTLKLVFMLRDDRVHQAKLLHPDGREQWTVGGPRSAGAEATETEAWPAPGPRYLREVGP